MNARVLFRQIRAGVEDAKTRAPEVRVADGSSALGDVSAARNLMKKVYLNPPASPYEIWKPKELF